MRGTIAIIVTLLIAAIVGVGAYQLGLAQGAGVPAVGTVAPVVYYHPFFGFGFFGLLFPLLFLFLIFGLVRAAAGAGRGRYGTWGSWSDREARFEEWHRRMHGETTPPTSSTPPTGR